MRSSEKIGRRILAVVSICITCKNGYGYTITGQEKVECDGKDEIYLALITTSKTKESYGFCKNCLERRLREIKVAKIQRQMEVQ